MKSSTSSAAIAARIAAPFAAESERLLRELVQTDTTASPPNGKETAGQRVLQEFLVAHGFTPDLYECGDLIPNDHPFRRPDRDLEGRLNLVVRSDGAGSGRSLLLSGHMDTVPPGRDAWTDTPWSGAVLDGKLYGRGSFDMKGGLAAQFIAACALKRAGVKLAGDLICESVIDEEWGGGAGTLAGRLRGDLADACLIPEGTQLEAALATRGGAVFDLICRAGDSSTYFSTAEVLSPALPIGRLLGWIEQLSQQRRKVNRAKAYAAFEDPAPVQVLAITSGGIGPDLPLSTPLEAAVRVYMQFQPNEEPTDALREARHSLQQFCQTDPFFSVHPPEWRMLFDPPLSGHELAPEHDWAQCLMNCASESLGRKVQPTAAPYPCDAFLIQNLFGIPTLLFGPSGGGAHNADEFVELASVHKTTEVMIAAALEWCGA